MREPLKWIVIYIWYHLGLNSVLHFGQTYVFDIIMTYKMTNRINTGIAIKYHGTSKWLPNQLTWQEDSIRAEISKSKETNIFFISSPPFWVYYSIKGRVCQSVCAKRNIFGRSPHHLHGAQLHLRLVATAVCVRLRRNDVSLWLNDVACVAHKWCCVLRTQMKKSWKRCFQDFLARVDRKDAYQSSCK